MTDKKTNSRQVESGLPGYPGKTDLGLNKPVRLGILAFVILAILFSILIYQRYTILKEAKNDEAYEILNATRDKLQQTLAYSLSATKTLSFFIDSDGSVKNFDSVAVQLFKAGIDIDALQLVPGGVIRYVYPLKGNENVIGYDILKDPSRNKEALKAIEKKELYFAGPFELRQGGMGVVGRLPVFRNNDFWGFSAVVIKMPTLLKAAGIDTSGSNGYYFQLSKLNPDTKKEEFFLPYRKEFKSSSSVSVNVRNAEWKLSLAPSRPYKAYGDIVLLAVLGVLVSLLGGAFVYTVAIRPQKLDELVKVRTRQLKESDERFLKAFHSNVVGFAVYDKDFRILDINRPYAAILGTTPGELIGKTSDEAGLISRINVEKREAVSQEIERILDAEGQLRNYETEILSREGEPFTVLLSIERLDLVNSTNWLTSVIDITAMKKAELLVKVSEEKYRTLIEQASDGIVITDLDGNILEVNKSLCAMSGYSEAEVLGQHIIKFLPAEDTDLNPLRFKELMQGKALLYERRLLKKDGTALDIEVNSKMATTHTLIGFIRDISERKKSEDTLRYQARLLESVTDAVTSLDINRHIVSWNKACEELYGFTPEEALGKRIPELVTFEYPGTSNEEVFRQVYTNGRWRGEFDFIQPKTKRKTHLLSSINALKDKEGAVAGFIITSKDITDRKNAEEEIQKSNERFEIIAQATNDAVWDHDFTKNETWGNKKLYSLYGFDSVNAKIDFQMFIQRIHPDERDGIVKRLQDAIGRSEHSIAEEFHFKTATGEYRTFYDRAYIKYGADGRPQRILGAMQDVTDREHSEKQILKEKELSDTIINSLPGVFYLFNKEGKFLRWNKNFETVTGYTANEFARMHPMTFFKEEDQELMRSKVRNVFAAGEDSVEVNLLLKNKEIIPYYFTGLAIEYQGEPCMMGVGFDISEKEDAAKAIRESEERYRVLVENAPEALVVFDVENGNFVSVSESAAKLFGIPKEELLKIGPVQVSPAYQPDGRPSPEAALAYITKAVQGEKPVFEWTHCDAKGNTIPCEVWLVRLPSKDKVLIRGSIIDITERKKAEAEILRSRKLFQNLVENISGVYWVNDLETYQTLYISPSYETIWGLKCEDLYKNPADFINSVHPGDKAVLEEAHKNIGNTRKINISYRIVRPDGEIRWISAKTNVVQDAGGGKIEYGYAEDITERKKSMEELHLSEQKYRLLFYNNPLPMWMVTIPDLRIIDVNEAAIKQYGYSREEFLQLSTKQLRPEEDVSDFLKEVAKMKPDVINVRAWRHKKKDGTVIHVETYSHQIMYEGRMVWLGLSHDVTEQHKAKVLLQKSYEEIRQLASNLQSIREDERTNIAREIHDELGQQLTGLKMDMHWLNRKIQSTDEEINKKMKDSIELVNSTIATVRKIATDLRPSILDDLGLLAALEWQSEEFERRSGTKVVFTNEAGDISVVPHAATALFRIYQEVLTNIARHAVASQVNATLKSDDKSLYFSIRDNGVGFDVNSIKGKKTLGLLGIKERSLLIGGTYEIKSKPGQGSEIVISIPLEHVKTSV